MLFCTFAGLWSFKPSENENNIVAQRYPTLLGECWAMLAKGAQTITACGRCCMELIPQGDMGSIFTQKPFQNHGYQASSGHAQAQQCCANKPLRFNSHKNKRNNGRCGVKSLNDFKLHVTCANIMQHCPVSCTNNLNMWHPTILVVLF